MLVREVRESMRAVDNRLDAARPRQLAYTFDRIDLPAQIGDVTEVDDACARRDGALEEVDDFILAFRRNGDGDFF
jgi:hypothetical protein